MQAYTHVPSMGFSFIFDFYLTMSDNTSVGFEKGIEMRDEFACGVTDARMDRSEGWLEEGYGLDALIAHLRVAGDYSDLYIAGYISVVFGE